MKQSPARSTRHEIRVLNCFKAPNCSPRPARRITFSETWCGNQSSVDFRGSGKKGGARQELGTMVCFKSRCLGAVMCHASTVKNKHPAEAGFELRRVHNKFQLVKLIARCLLWILIPGRELASTQSKDRWKLKTAKHLGSLEGRLTCEPSADAESHWEAESNKQPLPLCGSDCTVGASSACPQPAPVHPPPPPPPTPPHPRALWGQNAEESCLRVWKNGRWRSLDS